MTALTAKAYMPATSLLRRMIIKIFIRSDASRGVMRALRCGSRTNQFIHYRCHPTQAARSTNIPSGTERTDQSRTLTLSAGAQRMSVGTLG